MLKANRRVLHSSMYPVHHPCKYYKRLITDKPWSPSNYYYLKAQGFGFKGVRCAQILFFIDLIDLYRPYRATQT